MDRREDWIARLTSITAVIAWVLANGIDVLSVLFVLQNGGRLAFALHHQVEYLLIYAGMRMLGTLAVYLLVAFVSKHWPSTSRTVSSALTACALVTAVLAWWRLYQ